MAELGARLQEARSRLLTGAGVGDGDGGAGGAGDSSMSSQLAEVGKLQMELQVGVRLVEDGGVGEWRSKQSAVGWVCVWCVVWYSVMFFTSFLPPVYCLRSNSYTNQLQSLISQIYQNCKLS